MGARGGTSERVLRLVDVIYEAALDPSQWERARGAICRELRVRGLELDDLRASGPLLTSRVMHERRLRPEEVELVHALVPHLRRALGIGAALGEAELRVRAGWEPLERMQHGIFLLDADAKVVRVNTAGRQMLLDGLLLRGGGLGASDRAASRALVALVGLVAAPASVPSAAKTRRRAAPARSAPAAVRIPRPSGRADYVALVVPLSAAAERPGLAQAPGAMCIVTDPSVRVEGSATLLAELFALTPAEARVALAIGRGDVPKDAARAAGLAYETVRSHLARVYEKTGTHSQASLVALLGQLGTFAHHPIG